VFISEISSLCFFSLLTKTSPQPTEEDEGTHIDTPSSCQENACLFLAKSITSHPRLNDHRLQGHQKPAVTKSPCPLFSFLSREKWAKKLLLDFSEFQKNAELIITEKGEEEVGFIVKDKMRQLRR
jgi:hypothetical protein